MLGFVSRGTGGAIASDSEVVSAVASGLAVAGSAAESKVDSHVSEVAHLTASEAASTALSLADAGDSIANSKITSNVSNISIADSKAVSAGGRTSIIEYRVLEATTDHTVTTGVGGEFRVPVAMTVIDVGAYNDTAGSGGVTTIDINEDGTSILSTKLTIDADEKTSVTADADAVISDGEIAADAILTFDIDAIASGTAGKGLTIWLKVLLG